MARIEVWDAGRPDSAKAERKFYVRASELKIKSKHTQFILCDCNFGDMCCNGRGRIVGAMDLCRIRCRKTYHAPASESAER
jgi:hypothetical protein